MQSLYLSCAMSKLVVIVVALKIAFAVGLNATDSDCFREVAKASELAMQVKMPLLSLPDEQLSPMITLDGGRAEKMSPVSWGPTELYLDGQDEQVKAFRTVSTIKYLDIRYNYTLRLPLLASQRAPVFVSLRNIRALPSRSIRRLAMF